MIARLVVLLLVAGGSALAAQDNYEIQVYGAETVPAGRTMVELHSNYTANGRRDTLDGLRPTDHAIHETLELTHGFTPWFEIGFYLFTSARAGDGWQWVGDHIRPRFRVPDSWHWPVGVSLSQEFGYQRRAYAPDTWTWEIRPIVDRQDGPFYWAIDPTLERSLTGANAGIGFEFSPNVEATFDVTKQVTLGVEYYGAMGPLSGFDPAAEQEQQVFPALDLNLSPDFEFNLGLGFGLTRATDRFIIKMITGYRLPF
ncbi:MAG TPA: hypothetical protein VFK78_01200 [Gemmatimonadales bacterium]|nr:hypothetical protein [Gemmatimonadales bacterium]